jgi:uncharacterized membrane protein YqgA involved in biofilm formation
MIAEMTATGGVMILAIGLLLLDVSGFASLICFRRW